MGKNAQGFGSEYRVDLNPARDDIIRMYTEEGRSTRDIVDLIKTRCPRATMKVVHRFLRNEGLFEGTQLKTRTCEHCGNALPKTRRGMRRWCKTCVPTLTAWHRMHSFNISEPEFQAMLTRQNHTCAICPTLLDITAKWVVCIDHDHVTGKIRGILCRPCNRALGFFRDSTVYLQNAIVYLTK